MNCDSTVPPTIALTRWEHPGEFAARSLYVERCFGGMWGPTATLALRTGHDLIDLSGGRAVIAADAFGALLGVGARGSAHGVLGRSLQRLEMFGAALATADGWALRTHFPPLGPQALARRGPLVQGLHQVLCGRSQRCLVTP